LADATVTRSMKGTIAVIVAVVCVLTALLVYALHQALHSRAASQATVTITVVDKRADCATPTTGSIASCTWRIFTDTGVFADHNEISAHKLNSQDLYSQLMYGGVYKVEIRGTRHDTLGVYPNIIKIVKVISQGHPNPAVVITPST